MKKAIVIHKMDNVATALECLHIGDRLPYKDGFIEIKEEIQFGHKVAVEEILKGLSVIKYGEPIGISGCDIGVGRHVHVHNVMGQRGRGDLQQ